MEKRSYEIKGTTPLVLNNGQMANPFYQGTIEIKGITAKRKKTEADLFELAWLEWFWSHYFNEDGKLIMPAENIEAFLVASGKADKLGQVFKKAVLVDNDAVIEVDNWIDDHKKRFDDGNFRLDAMVRVQTSKVLRTRPMYKLWKAKFTVTFMDNLINAAEIDNAVKNGGLIVGWGDWRPRYGRFEVTKIK